MAGSQDRSQTAFNVLIDSLAQRPQVLPSPNVTSTTRKEEVKKIEDHHSKLLVERRTFQATAGVKRKAVEEMEREVKKKRAELRQDDEKLKKMDGDIKRMDDGLSGAKAMQRALDDINAAEVSMPGSPSDSE